MHFCLSALLLCLLIFVLVGCGRSRLKQGYIWRWVVRNQGGGGGAESWLYVVRNQGCGWCRTRVIGVQNQGGVWCRTRAVGWCGTRAGGRGYRTRVVVVRNQGCGWCRPRVIGVQNQGGGRCGTRAVGGAEPGRWVVQNQGYG